MSQKQILLTGGAGYIGSHCAVALLLAGYRVIIVDSYVNSHSSSLENIYKSVPPDVYENLWSLNIDLADQKDVKRLEPFIKSIYAVIHLAAHKSVPESVSNPLKYYDNNLISLINILKCMERGGLHRIIFSSSATVYGETKEVVSETDPCHPTNPYGKTKWWGEQIVTDTCTAWQAAGHADVLGVSLRYMNPYGNHELGHLLEKPRGIPQNLFPVVQQVANGEREYVSIFGTDYETRDGTAERDYVHVMDVADAHVRVLDTMSTGCDIFNVGSGQGYTVREVVAAVQALNPTVDIPSVAAERRPGDITSLRVNVSKARAQLSWSATRNMQVSSLDELKLYFSTLTEYHLWKNKCQEVTKEELDDIINGRV